jgi:hypothetical protein
MRKPYQARSPSLVWAFFRICTQEVTIDIENVLDCLTLPRIFQPLFEDWLLLAQEIQANIDQTIEVIASVLGKDSESQDVTSRHLVPRILSHIGFSASTSWCFTLSVIYYPVAVKYGQAKWSMSLLMDARRVDRSFSIPFALWDIGTVSNPFEEHVCHAYHEASRTLAFAASILHYEKPDGPDKSRGTRFFLAKLYVVENFCDIGASEKGRPEDDYNIFQYREYGKYCIRSPEICMLNRR